MAKVLRPFSYVVVHANPVEGFDTFVRVRGGFMQVGTQPTVGEALGAAWSLVGRNPQDPVFVYGPDYPGTVADHLGDGLVLIQDRTLASATVD